MILKLVRNILKFPLQKNQYKYIKKESHSTNGVKHIIMEQENNLTLTKTSNSGGGPLLFNA